MEKTFILGVGAPKAGTTWLHAYLDSQSRFNMGCMKEYHAWNELTIEEGNDFLIYHYGSIFSKRKLIPYTSYRKYIRYKMKSSPGFYGNYFSGLIKGQVDSTGDISPAYSTLSCSTLKVIRKELEGVGFKVKVVFLLRDPFERCWSEVRMRLKKSKYDLNVLDVLKNIYFSRYFLLRTDYQRTIQAIESIFESKNIYYGLYEEMFLEENVERLSSFCGIIPNYRFVSKKFNVSEKFVDVDVNLKEEIINFYSNIYKFCYVKFPQTKLLWNKIK